LGCLLKPVHVNADWVAFDADAPASYIDKIYPAANGAKFLDEAASEIVGIPLCLHTYEIIVRDDTQKLGASGKSPKHFRLAREYDGSTR
jgi:hypothetical protein